MTIAFAPVEVPVHRRLQTAAVLQWIYSFLCLGECPCLHGGPLETSGSQRGGAVHEVHISAGSLCVLAIAVGTCRPGHSWVKCKWMWAIEDCLKSDIAGRGSEVGHGLSLHTKECPVNWPQVTSWVIQNTYYFTCYTHEFVHLVYLFNPGIPGIIFYIVCLTYLHSPVTFQNGSYFF